MSNFLLVQYFSLPDITIGGYDYASVDDEGNPVPIIMELRQYNVAELDTVNNAYVLDGKQNTSEITQHNTHTHTHSRLNDIPYLSSTSAWVFSFAYILLCI